MNIDLLIVLVRDGGLKEFLLLGVLELEFQKGGAHEAKLESAFLVECGEDVLVELFQRQVLVFLDIPVLKELVVVGSYSVVGEDEDGELEVVLLEVDDEEAEHLVDFIL